MIEKIPYTRDTVELVEKLNEVIDIVNSRASFAEKVFGSDALAEAAKKAATTGSHADLKAWLELRRKCL